MSIRVTICGLSLALSLGFAQSQAGSGASQCAELMRFRIPGVAMEMTKAEWIPAAPGMPASVDASKYTGPMPTYCRAEGVINRRTGVDGREYGIGFAVALPENWNHDFLMQGGGALNGTIQPPLGAQGAGITPGLARGFAVVSTDTGHKGTSAFDASFLKDQQAALDFAYQAIGRVAEAAKQIIAQYYGRPAAHSYFSGCSTGGREAMIMTQRYPTYFDGVVSGDPASAPVSRIWQIAGYGLRLTRSRPRTRTASRSRALRFPRATKSW
jgi:Tannase and feruloyl esterase